jgi:hypothetical protein
MNARFKPAIATIFDALEQSPKTGDICLSTGPLLCTSLDRLRIRGYVAFGGDSLRLDDSSDGSIVSFDSRYARSFLGTRSLPKNDVQQKYKEPEQEHFADSKRHWRPPLAEPNIEGRRSKGRLSSLMGLHDDKRSALRSPIHK